MTNLNNNNLKNKYFNMKLKQGGQGRKSLESLNSFLCLKRITWKIAAVRHWIKDASSAINQFRFEWFVLKTNKQMHQGQKCTEK
jgi:hypothetical protein